MDTLVIIAQFILSITILVFLHELGHFAPSKWFKTRVEKFYIFFDPWFSLFKIKRGDTEYGIGWLPLGGYVKIAGMVDESFDTEQLKRDPQPWEFRSKPAWQRLIIMLGGVTVNFLLGFFIFAMLLWAKGEEYLPSSQLKDGIYADSLGRLMGLQNGDKILKIGDKDFIKFNPQQINLEVGLNGARSFLVERNGVQQLVEIPEETTQGLLANNRKNQVIIQPRFPFKIAEMPEGSPAKKAGLMADDVIVELNGEKIQFFDEFLEKIKQYPSQEVSVAVLRGNFDTLEFKIMTTEDAKIMAVAYPYLHFFQTETQRYELGPAFIAGFNKGVQFIGNQLKAFGRIFQGKEKASESLGGFVSIAKLFPSTWDWGVFWNMTAILSLVLGFMNLLPIPGLDGGHVFFLFLEILTGKKFSDRTMERITMIGFIILISLFLYANGLDVMRIFKGN